MGTNFYLMSGEHVGKRSVAGLYCWDCQVTLCKGGEFMVHFSDEEWYDECPICGQKPIDETLEVSSVGRELGFNNSEPSRKKGVHSCCSFTWAILSESKSFRKRRKIKDEYGRKYTKKEFDKMMEECPIRLYDMIGQEFS